MAHREENDVYTIQTFNLAKRFTKKKHKGIFGFLRRNQRKEKVKTKNSDVVVALDHVNVNVRSSELFGLLGPNGAGKTTLVKCLSTILIPDKGTAVINGFDILKQTSMVRASLGMVIGGERTLYWKLTARDNLMYFASLYKMPRKETKDRVEELLSIMQLSDRGDERLEDYSTGMRQKIAIARSLLHDPPILLLDEPTLGLDPTFSRQIRSQIKELAEKQGKTILLATHYMEEADQLCDRVAVINNGKVIAIDTSDNLKALVKETELVEIACYNPPPDIKMHIEKRLKDVKIVKLIHGDEKKGSPSRIKLIGGNAEKHISAVMDMLRQKNTRICSLNIGAPTLEDVFIKLTGAKLTETEPGELRV
ncbi:MAG: ATP-binding cassette domain-containing protein [Candidatus Bathyarchaeota archaeon]|nr:MAG: ATP-binding cassette domain-containing protein [Candidatus Bathyarchaeota archaeon]